MLWASGASLDGSRQFIGRLFAGIFRAAKAFSTLDWYGRQHDHYRFLSIKSYNVAHNGLDHADIALIRLPRTRHFTRRCHLRRERKRHSFTHVNFSFDLARFLTK